LLISLPSHKLEREGKKDLYHSFIYSILILLLAIPKYGHATVFRVVIDPGHGGTDHGTVYHYKNGRTAEKEITLRLAKQVADHLRSQGIWVTLTREKDHDLSLPARTALANRLKADVFISIHMNSTENINQRDAEGIETYILNNTTDASSKRLAHLENSVISMNPIESPEQADVALILKDLRLDANLSESKRLACHIQGNLVSTTSRLTSLQDPLKQKRDRGVKQALFHVLLGADMPSVLVEAGFLSSARDRSILLSPKGQALVSHAIAKAVEQYRHGKWNPSKHSTLSRCKVN
jgi:N-acetylmuramoyl-L-alanine amidase